MVAGERTDVDMSGQSCQREDKNEAGAGGNLESNLESSVEAGEGADI